MSYHCNQCGSEFISEKELRQHLLQKHGLNSNPRETWVQLIVVEALLMVLMVASYFIGVSLGAESFQDYWHRVIDGGIQWKVST